MANTNRNIGYLRQKVKVGGNFNLTHFNCNKPLEFSVFADKISQTTLCDIGLSVSHASTNLADTISKIAKVAETDCKT
jgi:hypothetical protein